MFFAKLFRPLRHWFSSWVAEPLKPEPEGIMEERILRKAQPYN